MSVRPQPDGTPRVGCCSRIVTRIATGISDARARAQARRAHRRLQEQAAGEGLVVKGSSITRVDGERLGTAQLLDGQQVDVTSAQLARPNGRERLFGRRLVTLRRVGNFVGVLEINVRTGTWVGRGGLDTYSITNLGAGAPFDDEVRRAVAFLLKHAHS